MGQREPCFRRRFPVEAGSSSEKDSLQKTSRFSAVWVAKSPSCEETALIKSVA